LSNTFHKYERLCGKLRIASLYKEGRKFTVWPIRVTYQTLPLSNTDKQSEQQFSAVLIWAPKSLFKHATDRNRLRRLMREAWRLNKAALQLPCLIALNYIDKQQQSYALIDKAVQKAIHKINNQNDR